MSQIVGIQCICYQVLASTGQKMPHGIEIWVGYELDKIFLLCNLEFFLNSLHIFRNYYIGLFLYGSVHSANDLTKHITSVFYYSKDPKIV